MDPEQLRQKYPELLKECFDISIEPGWYNLVDELLNKLSRYRSLQVVQIKQKFASLRAYPSFNGTHPKARATINKLITEAENIASITCEACGETGYETKKVNGSWWMVLCTKHAEEYGYVTK